MAQAFQRQEPPGQHDHRDVILTALPTAPLKMIQPQLFFHLVIILLDFPTRFNQSHEPSQAAANRQDFDKKYRVDAASVRVIAPAARPIATPTARWDVGPVSPTPFPSPRTLLDELLQGLQLDSHRLDRLAPSSKRRPRR
jgi:hypothetical protein